MALVKYNNNSISDITAAAGIASGDMNLITTNTISSGVTSSSFTSNIDSTYDTYMFKFINLHPATNNIKFQYNFTTDGTNFNVSKTTTFFLAYHAEDGSASTLAYDTNSDLANGTGYQFFGNDVGNDNDQGISGTMFLFSPSNTTFAKHFMTVTSVANQADLMVNVYTGGYCNTTSAITGVDFKANSGNIDSGVIKMYGLSKS
jgi:hypothetical protein|tara:strand:- start:252 stop:860 length:609 start_codon:yes stop_codon:yes gene_type:complete